MKWYVYIIICSDKSLYTGITTDIERRFCQHLSGKGAKYFRARRPVKVVYFESGHTHASAAIRESIIKKMKRGAKILLVTD